jgi:hypothetical protein
VGSSKAANRAVSRVISRNQVSKNQVSRLRRPDAKAANKAAVASKVDNKAVSRAHKIVRLSFALSQKSNPPASHRGIFVAPFGD